VGEGLVHWAKSGAFIIGLQSSGIGKTRTVPDQRTKVIEFLFLLIYTEYKAIVGQIDLLGFWEYFKPV